MPKLAMQKSSRRRKEADELDRTHLQPGTRWSKRARDPKAQNPAGESNKDKQETTSSLPFSCFCFVVINSVPSPVSSGFVRFSGKKSFFTAASSNSWIIRLIQCFSDIASEARVTLRFFAFFRLFSPVLGYFFKKNRNILGNSLKTNLAKNAGQNHRSFGQFRLFIPPRAML